MPTIITGLASNVTTPLAATVSGATNATPIVITTPANHLYATGDRVSVAGVLGNTAANGTFQIIVLSSTTFSLTGSVGSGAYVSGGTCSNNSLTPQFTIPSDGDTFNAAAFNVAYQTLADRTQFLANLALVDRVDILTSNKTWTPGVGTTQATCEMYGGGGGGGGSGAGSTAVSPFSAPGGGGGGGSMLVVSTVAVTPGVGYACVVGAGSTGGAATLNGADGADSTFGALVTASGGQGGGGGPGALPGATVVQGGLATRLASARIAWSSTNGGYAPSAPGCGGLGANMLATTATQGVGSINGFNGGAAGANGVTAGTAMGGGGGGGGGGGPGGIGGVGSNLASAGSNSGAAAGGGSVGGNAAANTGAGGAGSNGGAQNTGGGTVGAGGTGGNGGSGRILIRYRGPQATIA